MKMKLIQFFNVTKAMLREKLTALNAYIINEERSKINNINFYFRKLEK